MRRLSKTITILCMTLLLVLPVIPTYADDWIPPDPFYVISEDGSRIFIVTPDYAYSSDHPYATGLYYNTNPPELIYPVEVPDNWALWEQDFFFTGDLKYFAWVPVANLVGDRLNIDEPIALVFYAHGEVQKVYGISDLVDDLDVLVYTVSTTQWLQANAERGRFIDFTDDSRLTLQTKEDVSLVFDIRTGEIVEGRERNGGATSNTNVLLIIGTMVLVVLIGMSVVVIKRRK